MCGASADIVVKWRFSHCTQGSTLVPFYKIYKERDNTERYFDRHRLSKIYPAPRDEIKE